MQNQPWGQWNQGLGITQPATGVTPQQLLAQQYYSANPAVPPPVVGAAQWNQAQQAQQVQQAQQAQQWQQWQQWHEKYQQWQNQYGKKYAESLATAGIAVPGYPASTPDASNPPLPSASEPIPPPPPEEEKAAAPSDDTEELSEAEKTFDTQFKQWEEQFNNWKKQNVDHPDKVQYREYEKKWESWREQLLERRVQMTKKRIEEKAKKAEAFPTAVVATKAAVTAVAAVAVPQPPAQPKPFDTQRPPPQFNDEPLSFRKQPQFPLFEAKPPAPPDNVQQGPKQASAPTGHDFNMPPGLNDFNMRGNKDEFNMLPGLNDFNMRPGQNVDNIRLGQNKDNMRPGQFNMRPGQNNDNMRIGPGEFNMRPGQNEFNMRGNKDEFNMRPGQNQFNMRDNKDNFNMRPGQNEFNMRGNKDDFNMRPGQGEFKMRLGQNEFSMRGNKDDFNMQPGQNEFNMRGNKDDFNMRGNKDDFNMRPGQNEFNMHGNKDDFNMRPGQNQFNVRGNKDNFNMRDNQGNFNMWGNQGNMRANQNEFNQDESNMRGNQNENPLQSNMNKAIDKPKVPSLFDLNIEKPEILKMQSEMKKKWEKFEEEDYYDDPFEGQDNDSKGRQEKPKPWSKNLGGPNAVKDELLQRTDLSGYVGNILAKLGNFNVEQHGLDKAVDKSTGDDLKQAENSPSKVAQESRPKEEPQRMQSDRKDTGPTSARGTEQDNLANRNLEASKGNFEQKTGNFGPNRGDFGPNNRDFGSNRGGFEPNREDFEGNRGRNLGFGREELSDLNQGDFESNRGHFGPNRGGFGSNRGGHGPNRGDFEQNRNVPSLLGLKPLLGPHRGDAEEPGRGSFGPNRGGMGPNQNEFGPNRGGFRNDRGGFGSKRGGFGHNRGPEFHGGDFEGDDFPSNRGRFGQNSGLGFRDDFGPERGPGFRDDFGPDKGSGFRDDLGPERGPGFRDDLGPERGPGFCDDLGPERGPGFRGDLGPERGPVFRDDFGSERGPGFRDHLGPERGPGFRDDFGSERGPGFRDDLGSERGPGFRDDFGSERGDFRSSRGGFESFRGGLRGRGGDEWNSRKSFGGGRQFGGNDSQSEGILGRNSLPGRNQDQQPGSQWEDDNGPRDFNQFGRGRGNAFRQNRGRFRGRDGPAPDTFGRNLPPDWDDNVRGPRGGNDSGDRGPGLNPWAKDEREQEVRWQPQVFDYSNAEPKNTKGEGKAAELAFAVVDYGHGGVQNKQTFDYGHGSGAADDVSNDASNSSASRNSEKKTFDYGHGTTEKPTVIDYGHGGGDQGWIKRRDTRRKRSRSRSRDRSPRRFRRSSKSPPSRIQRSRSRDRFGKKWTRDGGEESVQKEAAQTSGEAATTPATTDVTTVLVEDLICAPGRNSRPHKIVFIFRGLPGSGKSFVTKLIKDKEVEGSGSAAAIRILSLDDYFMVEVEKVDAEADTGRKVKTKTMEYDYEESMEAHYKQALVKSFKKTVQDGFFAFIIVDSVNETCKQLEEMWSCAKQNGFQVYVAEMDNDVAVCAKRNVHKRTEEDIAALSKIWEPTPNHYLRLDVRSLLQSAAITEVEMEDVDEEEATAPAAPDVEAKKDVPEEDESSVLSFTRSKWDTFENSEQKLDRLDGLRRRREGSYATMEDFLQLPDYEEQQGPLEPGKKRVRWADMEERKQQQKLRDIGFVVGQTDWKRMVDPTFGESALTRTKYI